MKLSHIAIFALLAAMSSCSALKPTQSPASTTDKQPTNKKEIKQTWHSPLEGEWAVTNVAGTDVIPTSDDLPSLSLLPNPDLEGVLDVVVYNGCNYLNGGWQVGSSSIKPVGEFISTLRACPDAPYQQAINQAINRTSSFVIDGKNLTLQDGAAQEVMRLRNHTLSFLNGAWRVTSIAGEAVNPSINIQVVLDAEEGRIHGSAGCNTLNGKLVSTLERKDGIEFRDLRTTRMTCPDIATEQAFLVALEEIVSVSQNGKDKINLNNDQGQAIVTMERVSIEQ